MQRQPDNLLGLLRYHYQLGLALAEVHVYQTTRQQRG